MFAHITSLIWYLGIGRITPNILVPRRSDLYLKLCKDTAKDDEVNDDHEE